MIVTIDGPAGAGKSTVTRLVAQRLGFDFLDTGAMYRAVTWAALEEGLDLGDTASLIELARRLDIAFSQQQVLVDGRDVTAVIRTSEVTRNVGKIADVPEIRHHLVDLQRAVASRGRYVCEGRDQGSVAFPDAFCKIYLTASPQARALRRVEQMQQAGQFVDYDQVVRDQQRRDREDESRPVGRLQKADDAIEVNTDRQSIEEVVDRLVEIVETRMAASNRSGDKR